MTADLLLTALKTAGLYVVEEPKWKTRGKKWAKHGQPEGVMQHGTGLPNPYPMKRLYGLRIKANMGTLEDGTLHLIAYRACNYSSGRGSLKVLNDNVRKSIAPTHNALVRGVKSGNRNFWNYENSHPNNRSAIPQVQLDTIVESTRIVLDHFELDAEQVISHAEWTRRKVDPLWAGSNRTAIEQIRQQLEDDMATLSEEAQQFFEDTYRELLTLNPNTTAAYAKTLVEHVRNHPTSSGIDEDQFVRKGQPVVIKGTT